MITDRSSKTQKIKNVGIWIRVSTEDQARGESPEHHEKRARAYAEAKGWKIRKFYRLEAISGKSVLKLPQTQEMLKDMRDGRIEGLIFSKLARLARNTRELLEISDLFQDYGADLISLQEAIDTSTPAGRLFFTVIAAMAQWEREEISERVAASVPVRAQLGKPLGGQAPFGYQWKDRKLLPDPQEAPVRKLLYEMFLEHKRKKTVARLLNEAGYRTRKGAKFSDTTVDRLLRDPVAKGLRRANYTRSTGDGQHWRLKPKEDWVYTEVEPVVSEELWDQCNSVLEEQRKKRKKPARKSPHLFTGFVYCKCGQKMYVPSRSPKYTCYKCRNKIPVDDLEMVFQEQLKQFLFSPDEIEKHLDQSDQQIREKNELLEVLQKEHRKILREMDRTYDLYMEDQITKNGFGRRYAPLEKRLEQLEDELPELEAEIDILKIHYLSSDAVLSEAKDLHSRWPSLKFAEKRQILETITEKVTIGDDEITINLCYLPSSKMVTSSQRILRGSWPQPT